MRLTERPEEVGLSAYLSLRPLAFVCSLITLLWWRLALLDREEAVEPPLLLCVQELGQLLGAFPYALLATFSRSVCNA